MTESVIIVLHAIFSFICNVEANTKDTLYVRLGLRLRTKEREISSHQKQQNRARYGG